MQKTFTFYSDPGHSWLKVSQKDCDLLNLKPDDFSSYSYMDRQKAGVVFYLEEDCDAGVFLEKYKTAFGSYPDLKKRYAEKTAIRDKVSIAMLHIANVIYNRNFKARI